METTDFDAWMDENRVIRQAFNLCYQNITPSKPEALVLLLLNSADSVCRILVSAQLLTANTTVSKMETVDFIYLIRRIPKGYSFFNKSVRANIARTQILHALTGEFNQT